MSKLMERLLRPISDSGVAMGLAFIGSFLLVPAGLGLVTELLFDSKFGIALGLVGMFFLWAPPSGESMGPD